MYAITGIKGITIRLTNDLIEIGSQSSRRPDYNCDLQEGVGGMRNGAAALSVRSFQIWNKWVTSWNSNAHTVRHFSLSAVKISSSSFFTASGRNLPQVKGTPGLGLVNPDRVYPSELRCQAVKPEKLNFSGEWSWDSPPLCSPSPLPVAVIPVNPEPPPRPRGSRRPARCRRGERWLMPGMPRPSGTPTVLPASWCVWKINRKDDLKLQCITYENIDFYYIFVETVTSVLREKQEGVVKLFALQSYLVQSTIPL